MVPVGQADVTVVWVALAVFETVPLVAVSRVIRVAAPVALVTLENVNVTVVTPDEFVADVQVAPVGGEHDTNVCPAASWSVTVTVLPVLAPA